MDIVERMQRDLDLGLSASIGDTKNAIAEIKRLRGALFRIEQLNPDDYFFDGYQQALVKELNRALGEKE